MLPNGSRTYIGIDPSLRSTGLVLIGDGILHLTRVCPKGIRGAKRLQRHRDALRKLLPGCSYSCIEAPAIGAVNRADDIGQLRGVLLLELLDQKVSTKIIEPTKLKLFGTGRGDASKAKMIETAEEKTGLTGLNDDEADAFWLAYLAYAIKEEPTGLKRHQLEVIYGIRKPKKQKNRVSKPRQLNI